MRRILLLTVVVALASSEAQAGKFFRRNCGYSTSYSYRQSGPGGSVQASYATTGDPAGFTQWLNSVRAQSGLGPVGFDPNLAGWAAQNNGHQHARGMGHFVMGPARRQNSAMGSYSQIGAMWMASPAHRAALLDPSITRIGLSGSGSYWTFNAS